MKTLLALMMLTTADVDSRAIKLLDAIAQVESNNNADAIGDSGRSVGAYQLQEVYVDDVNRIAGTSYHYEDRFDIEKSRKMVRIYLTYWGEKYVEVIGKPATEQILARIHNGGPQGWSKFSTVCYWNKVKKQLAK